MTDATQAEFDTLAEWTADVATELGPDYYVPAGCRGSGSPAALDWLLDHMQVVEGDTLLDCGAGVGGAAAYAARSRRVRPTLVEPEPGGCRAAMQLFGYPTIQAAASALPFTDGSFDAAWSLGVLCTMPDQVGLLEESGRVVRHGGRIGLLTFVAHVDITSEDLASNHFPTSDELSELVASSQLAVEEWQGAQQLSAIPEAWQNSIGTVENRLETRHGDTRAWQLAERQSSAIGELLDDGSLTAELLVLRHVR